MSAAAIKDTEEATTTTPVAEAAAVLLLLEPPPPNKKKRKIEQQGSLDRSSSALETTAAVATTTTTISITTPGSGGNPIIMIIPAPSTVTISTPGTEPTTIITLAPITAAATPTTSIADLPNELCCNILSFVGSGHYRFVAAVNHQFQDSYKGMHLPENRHDYDITSVYTTNCSNAVASSELARIYLQEGEDRRGKLCSIAASAGQLEIVQWAREHLQ